MGAFIFGDVEMGGNQSQVHFLTEISRDHTHIKRVGESLLTEAVHLSYGALR
jgi:hypothetical protein